MSISKSDIKFYLTSATAGVKQTNYTQSIGGYSANVNGNISDSLVYPETTLATDVSLYGESLALSSYTDLSGKTFLSSGFEIIKVDSVSSNSVSVSQRSKNGLKAAHLSGDVVRGLATESIFNDRFDDDLKQYRCLAIKNTNSTYHAYNVDVFLRYNSRNPNSVIRIALEQPRNDYITGSIASGTKTKIIDSSLKGSFDDNHFIDSNLIMTSGSNINQERIILSFDSSTGEIVLDSSLPNSASNGDTFKIEPAPAQRVSSGIVSPTFGSGRVTPLRMADRDNPLQINVTGDRDHGGDLRPNDVIYVWLERRIKDEANSFDENSTVLAINYYTVE